MLGIYILSSSTSPFYAMVKTMVLDESTTELKSVLHRNLVFVHGKGGVGKTSVSRAIAEALSDTHRTLWLTLEDPLSPAGKVETLRPNLYWLNVDFTQAFEQYAALKIGMAPLTRLFLKNKLIRYLAKAAPGIHELVLLGKIWYERKNYDHVVVDMPSTGYGLAMFQSTLNFIKLFHGGPLHKDADAMIDTFKDARLTGHLIVALPEEMPLRESLDLRDYLAPLFPDNPAYFLVNKKFPKNPVSLLDALQHDINPKNWPTPVAHSALDYATKRSLLEEHNLRIWQQAHLTWGELNYIPPLSQASSNGEVSIEVVQGLKSQLISKAFV